VTWLIDFIALVVVLAVVGLVKKLRRYGGSEPSGSQPMKVRDLVVSTKSM
jgi:hypothetical protein